MGILENVEMECTIAAVFGEFALVATDQTHAHSILVVKDDETKTFPISDNIVMAVTGESGDTVQFAEFVAKNVQLYKMRNGYELCPAAAAAWTRRSKSASSITWTTSRPPSKSTTPPMATADSS